MRPLTTSVPPLLERLVVKYARNGSRHLSESGDFGDGTGRERREDLECDGASLGGVGVAVGGPELLGA